DRSVPRFLQLRPRLRLRPLHGPERVRLSPRRLVHGRGWPPAHLPVDFTPGAEKLPPRKAARKAAFFLAGCGVRHRYLPAMAARGCWWEGSIRASLPVIASEAKQSRA